jgi:N-acetyl-alpha-D-muramate 1-phosphate uridylyltransferase
MTVPHTAMLLAAGLGTRMRPLTEHTAKPLLPLGGRALLDHAIDRLQAAGIRTIVVNTHWHADRVADHLKDRPGITLLREETLLDTGGAVAAARDLLGPDPFFVVNGDTFWLDGPTPALSRLAAAWTGDVDAVLLVHRTFQVHSEVGGGDFAVDSLGRVRRRKAGEMAPFLYAGIQLVGPELFAGAAPGAFSSNMPWDRAIAADRLRALVHDGPWFHLSTPADLAEAESLLQARAVGDSR